MKTWKKSWRWPFRVIESSPNRVRVALRATCLTVIAALPGLRQDHRRGAGLDRRAGDVDRAAVHRGQHTHRFPGSRPRWRTICRPTHSHAFRSPPGSASAPSLRFSIRPRTEGSPSHDPTAAFADYAATLTRRKPDLHVDTTGAPFCGYSSQKLTGTYLGPPGTLDFADRITHIWTNTEIPGHHPPRRTGRRTGLRCGEKRADARLRGGHTLNSCPPS
jgi:hypothetical protein